MAVFREGYSIIEKVTSASRQIFPDACDFGAPTRKGDELWNAMKQLTDWYGIKGSRCEERYSTGRTVRYVLELMDEWAVSDGRKTEDEALETYVVSFTSCNKGLCEGYDGYLTVVKTEY